MRSLFDGCRTLLRHVKRPAFLALLFVLSALPSLAQAQAAGTTAANEGTLDPVEQILFLFAAITSAISGFLGKLIVAMLDVMIPIMQYQGFTTANAVIGGWSIVRDTVNMFFVIVLIVIAFGTIFGHHKFKWQSQVPKLLIFAIVINFSKTLCGIMIDFAQVVMLTFANALKDVAGGNFIQLLGLSDMMQVSSNASAIKDAQKSGATGTTAFDYFAAGAAAVFMMLWVTTVVFILLAVLVYRIVMLWILIVMAPLAWFAGGIPEEFHIAHGAYADWWKNFICYTAIGPVLVFFLWLTLAVAGSGQIAANDPGLNQVFTGVDSTSGLQAAGDFLTKAFELQRLASFIIGMAMLMAGLDAAAKLCSVADQGGKYSLKSLLGQTKTNHAANFTKDAVKRGGSAVASGLGYGAKGAGAAASKVGGWGMAAGAAAAGGIAVAGGWAAKNAGGRFGRSEAGKTGIGRMATAKGRAELARDLAKAAPGGLVGRALQERLGEYAQSIETDRAKELKEAGKATDGWTMERKLDRLANYAKSPPKTEASRNEAKAMLLSAMKDPAMRASMEANGSLGMLVGQYGAELESDVRGDKDMKATLADFKKKRPSMAARKADGSIDKDKLAKLIDSKEDLANIDPAEFAVDEVKETIKALKVRNEKGEEISGEDYILSNGLGRNKAKIYKEGRTGWYKSLTDENKKRLSTRDAASVATGDLAKSDDVLRSKVMAGGASFTSAMSGRANAGDVRRGFMAGSGATIDAASDRLSGGVDQLAAAVQSNINQLHGLNTSTLANSSDADMATLSQGILDSRGVPDIVSQYRSASQQDREAMESEGAIQNMRTIFEKAYQDAQAKGDAALQARLKNVGEYLENQVAAVNGATQQNLDTVNRAVADLTARRDAARSMSDAQAAARIQSQIDQQEAIAARIRVGQSRRVTYT